jgi:hypothetical protein
MASRRTWTPGKRRRARRKAESALKERRRIIAASQDRKDTAYAGMVPVVEYTREILKVPQGLPEALDMIKGPNATYTPVDEAMAYLACQMAGIVRLNHIDRLLPEGVIAEALGIPQWMSENTEQRFLKRATEKTLGGIDRLTQRLIAEEALRRSAGVIEVDGDATSIPQRARKREGVEPGYVAKRKGGPCYQQPRVTVNGLPWWTDLRAGSDGCRDLFGRTRQTALKLARKHPGREVIFRLDGGFASKQHLREAVEAGEECSKVKFFLAIHATQMKAGRWEEMVAKAPGSWRRMNSTTEVKELGRVRPWGEETPGVRAVAVRREERAPKGKKKPRKKGPEWDLRYLIVTNATRARLGTTKAFGRYHQRQREEFSFKDGKQSLSTAKMPTANLRANRMHVKMVAMAQGILHLFASKFVPHAGRYGPTCKTLREKVIVVGGKNRKGEVRAGAGADVLRVPLAALPGETGTG